MYLKMELWLQVETIVCRQACRQETTGGLTGDENGLGQSASVKGLYGCDLRQKGGNEV